MRSNVYLNHLIGHSAYFLVYILTTMSTQMLKAEPKQFSLSDAGEILYRVDASNPLPGTPVARVVKGSSPLSPLVTMEDDLPAVQEFLLNWLKGHIATVLEPLVGLVAVDDAPEPVKGICACVFQAMGIVPREELEEFIKDLDPDMRKILREKGIRLGPILVFMPALNKPAAVRLRALLWSLDHGKDLPAAVPHDGIVSTAVDPEKIDPGFYQAIGYPVYGPRAIRIDMLDRVICAVYDGAKEGKFQAKHEMAEWLGSSIEDLYAVLTAMGHRKIHDPAENAEDVKEGEEKPKAEGKPEGKPELATFALKKGKANEQAKPRSDKKPYKAQDKKKGKKKEPKKGGRKDQKKDQGMRIVSSAPAPKAEDSPFAILEQLKEKKDASQ